jgi:hypothetical protein
MIQQAVLSGRMDRRDDAYADQEREDDLGAFAGLRFVIPAGLLLWAALAFLLIHFL